MMMSSSTEEEMQNMFNIIDQIRDSNHSEIPKEFIEEILMIERKNLGNRENAYLLVKKKIDQYLLEMGDKC